MTVAVQRLEVMLAVMLACERHAPAATAADSESRAPLAAALAALPSRPRWIVAEAVVALGYADVLDAPSSCERLPGVMSGPAPLGQKRETLKRRRHGGSKADSDDGDSPDLA